MKYAILIMNTESTPSPTTAEGQTWYAEVGAWYEKNGAAGTISYAGHQLQPPSTAKTIRSNGVTDGPFIETKEAIGGFTVLDVPTLDEAVQIGGTWPGVDRGWITIEVRPVIEMS